MITKESCAPILKWPGGKRKLVPVLLNNFPTYYNRYFEPFIGGGALFFNLKPRNGFISDINPELINMYKVVRDNVNELIYDLNKHINTEEYFYMLRNKDREREYSRWSNVEKASRLIFLNKTCFNGLYRLNSQGYFNSPYGFYDNPRIINEENLFFCSNLLQQTEIVVSSFEIVEALAKKDDLIYLDPPYVPINKTSSFVGYSKEGFDFNSQLKLKNTCDILNGNGVKFILSNSYTTITKELYNNYEINIVQAARAINCKGDGRAKINECIIKNF